MKILCHTGITLHPHTGVSGTGLSIYFSSMMQLLVSLHPFSGYCHPFIKITVSSWKRSNRLTAMESNIWMWVCLAHHSFKLHLWYSSLSVMEYLCIEIESDKFIAEWMMMWLSLYWLTAGHRAFNGFLYLEYTYNNAVMNMFVKLMTDVVSTEGGRGSAYDQEKAISNQESLTQMSK